MKHLSLPVVGLVVGGIVGDAHSAQALVPAAEASDPEAWRPSRIVPAKPARWEYIEGRDAVTDYELGADGGWFYWPPFLQWRFLETTQWATSDPIVEVNVYPPFSGSTTNIEAFFLQIPVTVVTPPEERGMVIGFHGSNISTAQIFGVTSGKTALPEWCRDRGWLLLAPEGLHTSNMASVPSQNALEVDIALIAGLVGFARDKVYTYGFSMGGLNATSFALRHQDPYGVRTAGIIYHTGTTDIVRDYNEAPPLFQDMIWENPLVFGASPSADPFAYNRVNPTRFDATGVAFDEPYFQLDALKHTPFYFHWNTNDPTKYKTWTSLLEGALVVKGFTLTSATSTTPTPQHTIHSIDINAALDWVTQAPLGPLPSSAEIYADRPARYLWSRLESDPAPNVAHYEVSIETASNSFAVTDTLHVDELCLSLSLMGLDAGQPLSFMAESSDGTTDTYLIAGYPAPPSMILVDGGVVLTWGYDPLTAEVSVTPSTTATGALVEIFP